MSKARDLSAGAGQWTQYTPTLTGFTLGNGTITGYYVQIGKTVHCHGQFTWGSTSVSATNVTIGLPVTAARNLSQPFLGKYLTQTATPFEGEMAWAFASTTTANGKPLFTSATNNYVGLGNLTGPGTWGTGGYFTWAFTYEAA